MRFIRYGGLSPLKQDHYKTGDDKTFHNPPVKKGFYAFPYPYVERFLLTATNHPSHISNKSSWLKDDDGNKVSDKDFYVIDKDGYPKWDKESDSLVIKPEWLKFLKRKKIKVSDIQGSMYNKDGYYITILNKPRIFDYNGLIWHHLDSNQEDILNRSGSWVLTDESSYLESLKKEKHNTLKELNKIDKKSIGRTDPFLGKGLTYCKDHLEVFIERIK